jgi:carboxylesterase
MSVTPSPDRSTFEIPGRDVGVLLVHGFTGDTREMRPLAEHLNSQLGVYCYAPLLPGHGVPPHLMAGITDKDWFNAVKAGLDHVRGQFARVVVVGYSMGGALSAWVLSGQNPHPANGFVAIAPMIALRNPLIGYAGIVRRFVPWVYPLRFMSIDDLGIRAELQAYMPGVELDSPDVQKRLKSEIRFPTGILDELNKVAKHARHAAPKLTLPTLTLQGDSDITLDPAGAHRFHGALAANDKALIMYTGGEHEIVKPKSQAFSTVLRDVEEWVRFRFFGVGHSER